MSAGTQDMSAGVIPLEALHSDGEAESHQEYRVHQGSQYLEGRGGALDIWKVDFSMADISTMDIWIFGQLTFQLRTFRQYVYFNSGHFYSGHFDSGHSF